MPISGIHRLIYRDVGHTDLPLLTHNRSLHGVIHVTFQKLNMGRIETEKRFFNILFDVWY
jgi:hypothetical protein